MLSGTAGDKSKTPVARVTLNSPGLAWLGLATLDGLQTVSINGCCSVADGWWFVIRNWTSLLKHFSITCQCVTVIISTNRDRKSFQGGTGLCVFSTQVRFPLPELTARVNGPSWWVTGFHHPSTPAVLTLDGRTFRLAELDFERKMRVDVWKGGRLDEQWWREMTNECDQEAEQRSGYGDIRVE